MKQRIRFGVKVKLPFNLFPNMATFILYLTPPQASQLQERVAEVQGVLTLAGYPEIAARFFVEAG